MLELFASVNNRIYVLLTFKVLLFMSFVHQLWNLDRPIPFAVWPLVGALALNDFIRGRYGLLSYRKRSAFVYSMAASMFILAALNLLLPSIGISALIQLILIELIIFGDRLIPLLVGLDGIAYVLPDLVSFPLGDQLFNDVINFAGFLVVGLLFRTIIAEKTRTERLYSELQDANRKLQLYSSMVQELTITKERTRIAQEMHDSIGHSLVALGMNLEYAYQTVDQSPERTKEVLGKTLLISKEGMASLRKAVDTLNPTNKIDHLRVALNELFSNFDPTTGVGFELELDSSIEEQPSKIKDCLLKTVREALTNGIRHGGATRFHIRIVKSKEGIYMQIRNNGQVSHSLDKSHGLLGMEKRITALGGQMMIHLNPEFAIEVRLPVVSGKTELNSMDKGGICLD